jgi:hypothetical protein
VATIDASLKDFDSRASASSSRDPPLVVATPIAYESLSSPPVLASGAKVGSDNGNNGNNDTDDDNDIRTSSTRHPTSIRQCPHCDATNVTTSTKTYPGPETFVMCVILMLVFWPVCWMPLVMDSAKRTDHICKRCGGVVGYVKPLSDCCVERRG